MILGTRRIMRLDPDWRQTSASLRRGILYVKMPRGKVASLLQLLDEASEDLFLKEVQEMPKSFVMGAPVADWREDLQVLKSMQRRLSPPSDLLIEVIGSIEAGLRNEPKVDWIFRTGGPPSHASDVLSALEPIKEPSS